MDKAELSATLAEVEVQLSAGAILIEEQKRRIFKLAGARKDVTPATKQLIELEESQALLISERERLRQWLAEIHD
jgi:hypothetical protein